jgi:large subunit ribosomal protein L23
MKNLIVHPLITEKSMARINEREYQFVVPTWATKPQIAAHITKQFNVAITAVRVSPMRGKKVNFRRKPGVQATYKKAHVFLAKGQSIADFALPAETANPTPEAPTGKATPEARTESKITVRSKGKKAGA